MSEKCMNSEKCPIYSGVLKGLSMTSSAYRQLYCDAGSTGWNKCRRYQVKERGGKVPDQLLPNSLKSVEEIIRQYGLRPVQPPQPGALQPSPRL